MIIKTAFLLVFIIGANSVGALDLQGTNKFTGGTGIIPEASSTDSVYNNLDGIIRIPKAGDGHYYTQVSINGVMIRFMVDTGATSVTLSYSDAKFARLGVETLNFNRTANTVNGPVNVAVIMIEQVKLHGFEMQEVRAIVTENNFDNSLLGMSYLSRFSKVELTEEYLLLYP